MNSHATGAVAELLEVTAAGHPQLLDYLLGLVLRSPARSALYELAAAFDVPHDQVGREIHRACVDLDRLERLRGAWRDPAKILGSPNLAALLYVCYARRNRVSTLARQRRLENILRRVERAYELARSRAWIEAFIGPMPEKAQEAKGDNRSRDARKE